MSRCEKCLPEEVVQEEEVQDHKGVHCYLCGRRCLLASLALHVPKCYQRWLRENNTTRRKHDLCFGDSSDEEAEVLPPQPPSIPMPTRFTPKAERDAYSEEALRIFERTRPSCVFCRRAFESTEKLTKHHRNCSSVEVVFECQLGC